MTQQLVLEPLGIITEPNRLGHIPAGAMSSARNICIRRPGVVENREGLGSFSGFTSDAGTTCAFVITPPGSQMLVIFNRTAGWFYQWINQASGALLYGGGGTALTFTLGGQQYPQSIPLNVQPGFSYVIHGKQLLVNMFSTVIVWDTYEPANSTEAKPRPAGLFPPRLRRLTLSSPGTAMPTGAYANYIAIYKRQVGDMLLVSAPSSALYSDSGSTGDNVVVDIEFQLGDGVRAGDLLEIYRTKTKPINGTGVYLPYQKAEEAGAEYQKATSVTLTAANITAGYVEVVDKTADAQLGEALYTNQAVNGLGAAAYPPPALRFMTSHKGHVFGFGTTNPPTLTIRPTGVWGGQFGDTTQARSGFGSKLLTGCTWSAGGPPTVVSVSPTSQLGFVKVGMAVSGFSGYVTAIGASTFTVNAASADAGSSTPLSVFDAALIGAQFSYIFSWSEFADGFATEPSTYLIAPALKLPAATGIAFTAQPTDGVTIRRRLLSDDRSGTFYFKSSGEQNWDPDVTSILAATGTPAPIENKPRQFVWSEQNQPESFPFVQNDTFARGTPCAFASTRDSIVAFYTDAIWVISGTGGSAKAGYDWRADPIITGITICGSQALCVYNDVVYAMTSEGLIAIEGTTVKFLSKGRIHDQLATPPWSDGPYSATTACWMIADEENGEIIFREPSAAAGRLWVYNVATDTFVQIYDFSIETGGPTHGDYSRFLRGPVTVAKHSDNAWKISRYATGYDNAEYTYQPVYADNPFSQRQWQSVDLSAEPTVSGSHYTIWCNGLSTAVGNAQRPLTNGRLSVEVPRNAPAIGNTMAITVFVSGLAGHTRVNGVALNYRDTTDRRRKR